jgi:uncharacterized protein (DUF983 family)
MSRSEKNSSSVRRNAKGSGPQCRAGILYSNFRRQKERPAFAGQNRTQKGADYFGSVVSFFIAPPFSAFSILTEDTWISLVLASAVPFSST